TTNGGSTWAIDSIILGYNLYGISFRNAKNGWIVGWGDSSGIILARKIGPSIGTTKNTKLSNQLRMSNYPNPFSQITTVRYYVPQNSFVIFRMMNSLGVEVYRRILGYEEKGLR